MLLLTRQLRQCASSMLRFYFQAMYQMVGEWFLSTLLVDGLSAPQRMERIFGKVDRDGDVLITFEEFRNAALVDPSVVNLLQFQGGMRFPRRRSSVLSQVYKGI